MEIVRRWLEGLPEDPEDIPAFVAELWESDGDYYPVRSFPEARPCHGREEIVRFGVELIPAWSEYRYVVKDARAIGDDRVFAQASFMPREARAAWRLKARPTIAAGSGMDDSSGSRIT